MNYPANTPPSTSPSTSAKTVSRTSPSTSHLTRYTGARITLRELEHYVVVTHAVNAPKGATTEYFIERTLYDNHMKEQVAYAISTGEFKGGALINIMTRAAVVREGNTLVKCRYDLGDMLEAFHAKTQAELKDNANIFDIPFVLEDAQIDPTVED